MRNGPNHMRSGICAQRRQRVPCKLQGDCVLPLRTCVPYAKYVRHTATRGSHDAPCNNRYRTHHPFAGTQCVVAQLDGWVRCMTFSRSAKPGDPGGFFAVNEHGVVTRIEPEEVVYDDGSKCVMRVGEEGFLKGVMGSPGTCWKDTGVTGGSLYVWSLGCGQGGGAVDIRKWRSGGVANCLWAVSESPVGTDLSLQHFPVRSIAVDTDLALSTPPNVKIIPMDTDLFSCNTPERQNHQGATPA
eukprot:365413-Chlamydomonas_euryale.AAC.13